MADKNLDEYKPLKFYKSKSKPRKNGFAKFKDEGSYYFALFKDGDIAMISQAYVSEAGRDNGIESVRKNSKVKMRYHFDRRAGGKHGFALKAGNGQEVAISPNYGSKAKAEYAAGRLNGSVKKAAAAPKKTKTTVKKSTPPKSKQKKPITDGRIENYHPLAFYKSHGNRGVKDGFDSFSHKDAHYFTYNKAGKIVLISESYTSRAGRDNGIASAAKNLPLKTRYQQHVHKNGKHYFDLNAANGQEIATSIWYGSGAAALAGASALRGEKTKAPRKANDEDNYRPLAFYTKHTKGRKNGIESFKGDDGLFYFAHFEAGKIRLISEGYPTKTARDTGVASVKKNIKLANRYDYRGPFKNGKYDYRLKAGNGKEIARSVWYSSAAAAATGAAYLIGTRKRPVAQGKIKGKAKPAKAAPAAVKTVAPVPKPKPNPKPKPKPKKKTTPKAAPIVAAAAASAALAAPAMAKAAKPVAPRDKDDDYLKCEAYHGHEVTDTQNNVAFFSHTDNKEYFVVYDDDGDVLIRSEGFDSISKRSSELAAVLRLKNNANYFTRVEKNGYFMDILKDENGREVGRSCLRKIVPPVAAVPVAAAALAAPIAAKAAVPAAAASGGMGWGWLKWLLPLLLLLLLGFFGLKACGGDKAKLAAATAQAEKVAADKAAAAKKLAAEKAAATKKLAAEKAAQVKAEAAEKAAAVKAAADERVAAAAAATAAAAEKVAAAEMPAAVVTPPAPKAAAPKTVVTPKAITANMNRLCSASQTAIFNVPAYATPVSVNRLGTFPEFGDSHGLTPTQFYDKLANRYAASPFDARYLNYLARSLGYKNGFSDMSAADFSNETLAKGTKGLLGYGEFHGTAFSQLNVSSPRDLEAFRVRAANGTDIHFMKTCGNYMYVCN